MSESIDDGVVTGLIVVFMVFTMGLVSGFMIGKGQIRRGAIEARAAHYEVNPTTGQTTFVWNTSSAAKQGQP